MLTGLPLSPCCSSDPRWLAGGHSCLSVHLTALAQGTGMFLFPCFFSLLNFRGFVNSALILRVKPSLPWYFGISKCTKAGHGSAHSMLFSRFGVYILRHSEITPRSSQDVFLAILKSLFQKNYLFYFMYISHHVVAGN